MEIAYELNNLEFFGKKSPPYLGGCNFFTFDPFFPIFNAIDAPKRGLHPLLGYHKQWGPPRKMVSKPYLKCLDIG